jgi:hypothetical protein
VANEDIKLYLDRLLKMIPGEVISLYLVGMGFIPPDEQVAMIVWCLVCLAAVFVVQIYGTSDTDARLPPQWGAIFIAAVAFVIWVYSLGGPFAAFGIHKPWVGSLLVLGWTFFVPILYRGDSASAGPAGPGGGTGRPTA